MDLDGFKLINDGEGHAAGDYILVEVGRRIKKSIRTDSTVARFGGDEFALILTGLNRREDVEQTILRILGLIAEPYLFEGKQLIISASIGISSFPTDDFQPDILLRYADHSMHEAKLNGKNCYVFHNPDSERRKSAHKKWIERFSQALKNQELVLHYQPKIQLSDGAVTGVEALIRWQHPENGLIPPMDFLPIINGTDLAVKVSEWVIERAAQQWADWRCQGIDTKIAVNVAGHHLLHPSFFGTLQRSLAASEMPADRLEIEILETSAIENIEATLVIIQNCMAIGISFTLDDFGTGYSSLTHLKNLPVNSLKIDQSFIGDMFVNPQSMAIVQGLLTLAKAFGRKVVAEGIETPAHLEHLRELGCTEAQGYEIAHPLPAPDLAVWFMVRQMRTLLIESS